MLKLKANDFVSAMHAIGQVKGAHLVQFVMAPDARTWETDPLTIEFVLQNIKSLKESADSLDAKMTLLSLDRLISRIEENNKITEEDLSSMMGEIESRFIDEMEMQHLYILTAKEEELFNDDGFGVDVHTKFPSTIFDLDEAAKCFSLGRFTASIFHLMRVMEIALHAVSACLGIPSPITGNDKTWGSIIQKIRTEYRGRPNFSEMSLFQELHALLDSVKDAWRNGTMHVENKYTEDEAKVIFQTVKGYMIKLASRMDEQGLPLA